MVGIGLVGDRGEGEGEREGIFFRMVCFGLSSTLSFVFSTIHSVDRPFFVLKDSFRFKIGMGNRI